MVQATTEIKSGGGGRKGATATFGVDKFANGGEKDGIGVKKLGITFFVTATPALTQPLRSDGWRRSKFPKKKKTSRTREKN